MRKADEERNMDPKDIQIEKLSIENAELKIDLRIVETCLKNVRREAEEKIARLEAVLNEQNAMLDYLFERCKSDDQKDPQREKLN